MPKHASAVCIYISQLNTKFEWTKICRPIYHPFIHLCIYSFMVLKSVGKIYYFTSYKPSLLFWLEMTQSWLLLINTPSASIAKSFQCGSQRKELWLIST